MEHTFEDIEFRLHIYKHTLEYLKDARKDTKGLIGFCYAITKVLESLDYESDGDYTTLWIEYINSESLTLFPELMNYQLNELDNYGFWFDPKDRTIRIQILEEIIANLTKNITHE